MPAELRDADAGLVARLAAALGPQAVGQPEPRHLEEPRGRWRGRAAAVLRPRTAEEVARAVKLCARARVGIVPWSGGTGLVGGQVMPDGPLPVVLSLERMTRIRNLDADANVLTAEAGVILADLQAAARDAGRLFPLSLAAEGSARIGGNLATNAGGTSVLRYGNARDLCLGLEAVMADGSVLNGLSGLRKDNAGYDLRHLLIGSEGTLGIITAASLRLFPLPAETATAWIAVASPAAALRLLRALEDRLGATISAFELMHAQGMRFLAETMPELALPMPKPPEWAVLAEAGDAAGAGLAPRLEAALGDALDRGLAADALIAQNAAQARAFWSVRESIPEANRRIGAISNHDIALPLAELPGFIEQAGGAIAAFDPGLRVNCFGHLGDGNLHYNVFPAPGQSRADHEPLRAGIEEAVHDLVHGLGGTFSAEHGIGRMKTADLVKYSDPAKLAAMRAVKAALDPLGILNPGAVIGPGTECAPSGGEEGAQDPDM